MIYTIFDCAGIARRNIPRNTSRIPSVFRSNHKGIIIERVYAGGIGTILDRTQHIAHNAAYIHTCMHGAAHNIGIKDVRPFLFAIPNHVANNAARIPHCPDIGVIDIHVLNQCMRKIGNRSSRISRIASERTVRDIQVTHFTSALPDSHEQRISGVESVNSVSAAIKLAQEIAGTDALPDLCAKFGCVFTKDNVILQIGVLVIDIVRERQDRIQVADQLFRRGDFVIARIVDDDSLRFLGRAIPSRKRKLDQHR